MSRSGRIPISIPESTDVRLDSGVIYAKGKLGELSFKYESNAKVEIKDKQIFISKGGESPLYSRMWGTVRSRINNIVQGVSEGFVKELELVGVGYKATPKGQKPRIIAGLFTSYTF